MQPKLNQCRLCRREDAALEKSHFLPAGIYRLLRSEGHKPPNPFLLTKTTAVQTSAQQTAKLLCRECEQRLSKNGEKWVLRNCLQRDGSFPLASALARRSPDISSVVSPTKVYYASRISEVDVSALAYFAASIFWRGSIYPWNSDGTTPVKLGPIQERFRRYLKGDEAFPRDCAMIAVVREPNEID